MLADPRAEASRHPVRVAVAAPAGPRQGAARRASSPSRPVARRGDARETELFFDSLVREDRSVLDLLTADYTFVNERLARHYGIPNVTGTTSARSPSRPRAAACSATAACSRSPRRRPHVAGAARQVGDGSAARLAAAGAAAERAGARRRPRPRGGKLLSVRERMEEHRANPACTSCHRVIDPLGPRARELRRDRRLAHQGQRRAGGRRRASSTTARRSKGPGPAAGAAAHKDVFLRSFTENLMTYALGRRVEYFDMPTGARHRARRAKPQLPDVGFVLGIVKSRRSRWVRSRDRRRDHATTRAGADEETTRRPPQ
jgi:hypothetical protein